MNDINHNDTSFPVHHSKNNDSFTGEERGEQLFWYYTTHSGCISARLCGSKPQ